MKIKRNSCVLLQKEMITYFFVNTPQEKGCKLYYDQSTLKRKSGICVVNLKLVRGVDDLNTAQVFFCLFFSYKYLLVHIKKAKNSPINFFHFI